MHCACDRRKGIISAREMEIMRLVARGLGNKQIGTALHLSEKTIKNHLSLAYATLRVQSRTEAVVTLLQRDMITLAEMSG